MNLKLMLVDSQDFLLASGARVCSWNCKKLLPSHPRSFSLLKFSRIFSIPQLALTALKKIYKGRKNRYNTKKKKNSGAGEGANP